MSETIDPAEIAEKTGVPVEDVEAVLRELMGSWLFSHYVEWTGASTGTNGRSR